MIRDEVDKFQEAFPAVLEIPSKDHPYDPDERQRIEEGQKAVWRLMPCSATRLGSDPATAKAPTNCGRIQ